MGVIDSVGIIDGSGNTLAVIQRPEGPLERGMFSPAGSGTWVPEPGPQDTGTGDFGIDHVTGVAYFQAGGADVGDAADLWIEPDNVTLWLQR